MAGWFDVSANLTDRGEPQEVAAAALGGVVAGLLYGVKRADPATLMAVALFLAAVAMLATYLPARRATRVDPMVALRAE